MSIEIGFSKIFKTFVEEYRLPQLEYWSQYQVRRGEGREYGS